MDKLVVGILAHVDAGKTTLSEALLYRTGAVRTLGRVDHQDAFLDTFSMERQRGITIFSKQAQFPLQGREITLLDTPGHVDFASEIGAHAASAGRCDSGDQRHGRRAGACANAVESAAPSPYSDICICQ